MGAIHGRFGKSGDPGSRNTEILSTLAENYCWLRSYRDYERILDRLIDLVPDQPLFPLYKAESAWAEKADLKGVCAAHEALPSSVKDDAQITWQRVFYPMCARDFALAGEVFSKSPDQEMIFFGMFGPLVPRGIVALWLQLVQGNHPTMEELVRRVGNSTKKLKRTEPIPSC